MVLVAVLCGAGVGLGLLLLAGGLRRRPRPEHGSRRGDRAAGRRARAGAPGRRARRRRASSRW